MHRGRTLLILFVFPVLGCARPVERTPSCAPAVVAEAPGPTASSAAPPAPATTRLVSLDLPKAGASDLPPPVYDPKWTGEVHAMLAVTISKDEKTYVGGQEVSGMDELLKKAEAAKANDPEVRVVIMADRAAPWGKVVLTLDALKRSGITRIAFAVEAESPKR